MMAEKRCTRKERFEILFEDVEEDCDDEEIGLRITFDREDNELPIQIFGWNNSGGRWASPEQVVEIAEKMLDALGYNLTITKKKK